MDFAAQLHTESAAGAPTERRGKADRSIGVLRLLQYRISDKSEESTLSVDPYEVRCHCLRM